jgi:hypothetical protein
MELGAMPLDKSEGSVRGIVDAGSCGLRYLRGRRAWAVDE